MSLGLLVEQRKVEMCQRDRKNRESERGRERSGKEDDSQCASDEGTDWKSGRQHKGTS